MASSPPDPRLDRFDHVVVLMLENRSFDNILGYLPPPADGIVEKVEDGKKVLKDLSNPAPVRWDGKPVDGADKGPVHVGPGEVMDNPNPDPGEYYPHVNTQLYNCVSPHSNAYQDKIHRFHSPYNVPSPLPKTAPMTGFVQDYYDNYVATQPNAPTRGEYEIIMNSFPSHLVPVSTGLAKGFAVCDKWFCAVPSQTFCNRSFFNAGTSNGYVTNAPYYKWLFHDQPTIFNRLEEKGIPWAIYYDKADGFPLTLLIHFRRLWPYFFTHFHYMDKFYEDVRKGRLPAYSFVEPRLFLNHNDQHPPIQIEGWTQPSTVTAGEKLIREIYDAVRCAPPDGASNWKNTLLTITYDEHGGCYDHVSPVPATSPHKPPRSGQMHFRFDRLGVRVPTVMVSAWTSPFHVVDTQLQHTSMIRTLCEKWGLAPLTQRDTSAPDFLDVFDLDPNKPRDPSDWPTLQELDQPAEAQDTTNLNHPLNDLQRAIVGTANHLSKSGPAEIPEEMTVGEALELMHKIRAELEAL